MTQQSPIGIIGLGAMGMGSALALLDQGLTVHACDIRQDALDSFAQAGGHPAATPADLAKACDVIALFVVNADQAEAVLFGDNGAAGALAPGSAVISCCTIPADRARALGKRLEEMGLLMVDAPMSGGAVGARAGKLTFMASGSDAAFEKADAALNAMGGRIFRLGPEPGQGSTIKIIHQLLAGVHIAAAAEAMALGIKAGADAAELYEVVTNCAGNSWMFENRMKHVIDGDYTPLSAVEIFVKDLGLVLDTGRAERFPLPIAAAAHQQFLAASAAGYGREDDSAVIKVYRDLAGFDLPGDDKD